MRPLAFALARPLSLALSLLLLAGCGQGASHMAPLRMTPAKARPAAAPAGSAVRGPVTITTQTDVERVELQPDRQATFAAPAAAANAPSEVPNEVVIRFSGEPQPIPGATLLRRIGESDAYVYRLSGGFSLQSAEELEESDDVLYVEPNYIYRMASTPTATATPNDPRFSGSWGVGAINAPVVWPASQGAGITVAVIDTGVRASHPDLAGRVLPGKDYVNNDNDADDDQGHGTHVAGTIAAVANNGIGVAGVAPLAKILPFKVLAKNGAGSMAHVAAAIREAADRGARVINLSLGSKENSQTVREAIAYALGKGAVVVAAAGNEGTKDNPVMYPGANPGVIAVGAIKQSRAKADFSNWGDYVDVAAPGYSILSTHHLDGGYQAFNGTSMAAPHVAGAAALLLAKYPAFKHTHLTRLFAQTGRTTTGFLQTTPPRALDVAAAMAQADGVDLRPPAQVRGLVGRPGAPGEVKLSWLPADDDSGISEYVIRRNGAVIAHSAATSFIDAGLRAGAEPLYTVSAVDTYGNEGPISASVAGTPGVPSALYTSLRVTKRQTNALTIAWTTQTAARCELQWGTSPTALTNKVPLGTTGTHASVKLENLGRFRKYYYRVATLETAGEPKYSALQSKRTKLWWLF